jgi:hypothetical protein
VDEDIRRMDALLDQIRLYLHQAIVLAQLITDRVTIVPQMHQRRMLNLMEEFMDRMILVRDTVNQMMTQRSTMYQDIGEGDVYQL